MTGQREFNWLKSHGAVGVLLSADVSDLQSSSARVFDLMKDGEWHGPDAICLVAGSNGIPAREGLRRMRDLRPVLKQRGFQIERRRDGELRLFKYRITQIEEVSS